MVRVFYYIDRFLKIEKSEKLDLFIKYRLRYVFTVSIAFLLFISITIVPRVLFGVELFYPDYAILFLGIGFATVIWLLKIRKGFLLYRLMLLILAIILLPIFSFNLADKAWIMLPWTMIFFKCIRYEFNLVKAQLIMALNAVAIIYSVYFLPSHDYLIESLPLRIFVNFFPSLLYFMILEFFEEQFRQGLIYELKLNERDLTINKMKTSLNHEINNPLTVIVSNLKMMKNEKSYQSRHIENCEKSIEKISILLKELEQNENYSEENYLSYRSMIKIKS